MKESTLDECKHGLDPSACTICLDEQTPLVYVSGGGRRYHKTRECSGLEWGKQNVDDRGGERAPVKAMRERAAKDQGYSRCFARDCWPGWWNKPREQRSSKDFA